MGKVNDIGILGSGPAALCVAAACARYGATVTLIAPAPKAQWMPNYCMWRDELPPGMEDTVERVWGEAFVATKLGGRRLSRAYIKLNNDALQGRLWLALRSASATVVAQRAARLTHGDGFSEIHLADGTVERVRVVIDASGARSSFVERVHDGEPARQVAYGVLLDAPGHGFDPECAVLMDFRPAAPDLTGPPSFLYSLPLDERRLFLEETSLAHRPGVAMETLQARLEVRLSSLGLDRHPRLEEERCVIPMGIALPITEQPLVPFGAAAGMVHPASGYSIAHALRKAEPVSQAIVEALRAQGAGAAVAAGNAAVWPRAQRAAWELYAASLESIVHMSSEDTASFFERFFELDTHDWAGFLSGTLRVRELFGIMTRLYRILPASTRWHLVRTTVSAGAAPFARTFLQPRIP